MAGKSGRDISAIPPRGWKHAIFRWESMLILVFVLVNILGVSISSAYSLNSVLREMPRYFAEMFIMFGMGYILILGDIDISVGSIVCLSATVACLSSNAGVPMVGVVILILLTGLACGVVNGLIATQFTELPTMIITLATQIIFRGIAEVSLGNGGSVALSSNIEGFNALATKLGKVVPISFFLILICGACFITILSKKTFGRELYAIGSNKTAAVYAGINVQRDRFIAYALTGFLSGLCGLFLVTTSFGANTTTGQGFEMEVIAMCVFGGIATTGGKGNLAGASIAAFVIFCLRIALGQANVNTQLILVVIGAMLVVSVLIPEISRRFTNARDKRRRA
ncbi:MAG: ABC transporter permease [Oliverpabstia sp.]